MRGLFNSNVICIGMLGVLLLLASAVGRVTATNVSAWLSAPSVRAHGPGAGTATDLDLALALAWKGR